MSAVVDGDDRLVVRSGDATEIGLPIAGIGSRSYAFIIDWHFRLLLALAWLLLIWAASRLVQPAWDELASTVTLTLALLPAGILYFGYHPLLEITMHGRTPGKRMAGVRLVNQQGQTPSVGALLIRNVFRLVDSLPSSYLLGLLIVALHPRQLRLGDIAAGTLLVYEDKLSERSVEQAAALALGGGLLPRQQELLLDLLERWKGLDRAVRVRIGERLLQELGRPLAAGSEKERDRQLHARLSALAEDASRHG